MTGMGGINGINVNGLSTTNAFEYGNGISGNGIPTFNALGSNGMTSPNGVIGTNGIDASAQAGHGIIEIRLADGTIARTAR